MKRGYLLLMLVLISLILGCSTPKSLPLPPEIPPEDYLEDYNISIQDILASVKDTKPSENLVCQGLLQRECEALAPSCNPVYEPSCSGCEDLVYSRCVKTGWSFEEAEKFAHTCEIIGGRVFYKWLCSCEQARPHYCLRELAFGFASN